LPAGIVFDAAEWLYGREFKFVRRRMWVCLCVIANVAWLLIFAGLRFLYRREAMAARVCGKTGVWETDTDDCPSPPLPLSQQVELMRIELLVEFTLPSLVLALAKLLPAVIYLIVALCAKLLVSAIIFPKTALAGCLLLLLLALWQQDSESDMDD
jgi:hypothetical protein